MISRLSKPTIALTAVLFSITGCAVTDTAPESEPTSTSVTYRSLDDLAADSTAIVSGTVTDQTADSDSTVSTVVVTSAPSNPELGSNLGAAPADISVGTTVEVRQGPTSRPLLESGKEYLLWLTPAGQMGEASGQFAITGSNAGIYVRDGDTARKGDPNAGGELPDTIAVIDASN